MKNILIPLENLQLANDGSFHINEVDMKKLNEFVKKEKKSSSNGNCINRTCGGSINLNCES